MVRWLVKEKQFAKFETLANGLVLVHSSELAISEVMQEDNSQYLWSCLLGSGYWINQDGCSPTDPKSFERKCARLKVSCRDLQAKIHVMT